MDLFTFLLWVEARARGGELGPQLRGGALCPWFPRGSPSSWTALGCHLCSPMGLAERIGEHGLLLRCVRIGWG